MLSCSRAQEQAQGSLRLVADMTTRLELMQLKQAQLELQRIFSHKSSEEPPLLYVLRPSRAQEQAQESLRLVADMTTRLEMMQLKQAQLELRNNVLQHSLDMHLSHVNEVTSVKVRSGIMRLAVRVQPGTSASACRQLDFYLHWLLAWLCSRTRSHQICASSRSAHGSCLPSAHAGPKGALAPDRRHGAIGTVSN